MKKILAILVALATLLSLCACGMDKKDADDDEKKKDSVVIEKDNEETDDDGEVIQTPAGGEHYADVKVQKIGSTDRNSYVYTDSATRMKGIISLNGKVDTGAIYYDVEISQNGYYFARTNEYDTPDNFNSVNGINLVDPYCNTLLEGYCDYIRISDRFIAAAKAIEITESDTYDYYLHEGIWTMSADAGDTKYNADFYIFDMEKGKIIDGLVYESDPKFAVTSFGGDFLYYKDTAGVQKIMNANGYAVPEGAVLLSHGVSNEAFLKVESDGKGAIYDSDNNLLFSYDAEKDYVPYALHNGYFLARKISTDSPAQYVVLDKTGKVISAEFTPPEGSYMNLEVYGKVILVSGRSGYNYQICDFNGKVLAETPNIISSHDSSYYDNPQYYVFSNTKGDMIIVSTEGEVLYEVYGDTAYETDSKNCAYKTVGEDYYYFNLKDKDFNIKSEKYSSEAPYLIEVDAGDNLKDIIDVTTGKAIISGYSNYTHQLIGTDIYVYASNDDGTSDIYLVKF